VGNELLSGHVRDANSVYLIDQLRGLGVDVRRLAVIPDEVEAVRDEVRLMSDAFDYVFTSGGVGPTHDDVTISGIAAAFELDLERNSELEAILHGYYQEAITEATLRMADLPHGAALIGDGGGWFPVIAVRNVYIFPGVPEILRGKFDTIREIFRDAPFHSAEICVRADEGRVARLLSETLERFPAIRLGSYPNLFHPRYSLKFVLDSKDRVELESARRSLIEGLRQLSIEPIPDHPQREV